MPITSKPIGFDLPRAMKSARIREIIKELGFSQTAEEYAKAYRERHQEDISTMTVYNNLREMRADTAELRETVAALAPDVKSIPEDKLAVLLMLSERYGAKKVISAFREIYSRAA